MEVVHKGLHHAINDLERDYQAVKTALRNGNPFALQAALVQLSINSGKCLQQLTEALRKTQEEAANRLRDAGIPNAFPI